MKTISELLAAYRTGSTTPTEVVADYLATIKQQDPDIHAFLEVYETEVVEAAAAATAQYAAADSPVDLPPLLGIPLAFKNNILIKDHLATAGSKMLSEYTAVYDATIITKLKAAGVLVIGATNMDDAAMGSSTESSYFGPTKNPHDHTRVPGGSSGGSAAAVAAGFVPAAIGTDTGGSIRQPASYCGLVGFKPTYGAVSRYGLIAMGSSLDQAGPLAHTVADAKVLHDTMSGLDPMDATTIADDTYPLVPTKDTYTFGVPRAFLESGVDADVLESFEAHLSELQAAGHTVVDVTAPLLAAGLPAYYITVFAEISSNLGRYDGFRFGYAPGGDDLLDAYKQSRGGGFGKEVQRRILLGTHVLSAGYYDAYYGKAQIVRRKMREELAQVFTEVDMIVTPTAPTPAFKLGENADPLSLYAQDVFTVPVNLTGVPALSFPMGTVERDGSTLPIGVQYIAPHAGDERLFDAGVRIYDESLNSR